MWKFKTSKYKNAHPKIPRKEEWISNIKAANFFPSCGNHIAASAAYLTFNTDAGTGGCLGVLPIEARGRQPSTGIPLIHAHAEHVTDFAFSPFNDYLLATCSQDGHLKTWQIPDSLDEVEHITDHLTAVPVGEYKVEVLKWHSTADQILAAAAGNVVKVFDIERSAPLYSYDNHEDVVQALDWHYNGNLLVTSCKDKNIRVFDPRTCSPVHTKQAHDGIREVRSLFLGDTSYVLTTGCDSMRSREVAVHDIRDFSKQVCYHQLDASNGTMMPFYDAERGLLILAGKGDSKLWYYEFNTTNKTLNLNSTDSVEQMKGACMGPWRAVDVMTCEVGPMFILVKNAVVPLPFCVPRKSYTDFHSDLYPDVPSGIPALTAEDWAAGKDATVSKMSLDPSKNPVILRKGDLPVGSSLPSSDVPVSNVQQNQVQAPVSRPPPSNPSEPAPQVKDTAENNSEPALVPWQAEKPSLRHVEKPEDNKPEVQAQPAVLMRPKKSRVLPGVRQSKFRHLKGTILHRSEHIDNVRNINQSIPGESDMFHTNTKFCAVPLSGPGGLLAIYNLSCTGRLPDSGNPVIQNGSALMDFAFDPFDDHRIVTACDDGKIRIWTIPEEGLTQNLIEPTAILSGHMEKIYFIKFHPLAKDILASASYDMTVKIWDLNNGEECIQLQGHTDAIFSLAWSPDGKYCCTACKDGKIRLYNPRLNVLPLQEGPGPEGTRGARVLWVCDGKYLLVSGMDRGSSRELLLFDPAGLAHPVSRQSLSTEPSLLIPHYDEDSSTLFLTGRGDGVVLAFEIADEPPYFFPLSSYNAGDLHQALAFFPKRIIDVKNVEFAKALRLTMSKIEPVSFTVPRVKMEYFQDDLYPDTKNTWDPVMTSNEWLAGMNLVPERISLRPENMTLLSSVPVEVKTNKYESFDNYQKTYKTDEEKRDELLSSMNKKLEIKEEPLPQDLFEGVEEEEWDDY